MNYHDAAIRDNRLWIAMEYCLCSAQGVMRLQQAPLSEPEIAAVLTEALRGLQYLHTERQIIHRDVKAGNILLTDKGEVKLADFGVSAQMTGTLSKRNTVIGTPMWMSPEMIEAGSYDQRDLWSLGITAIELAEMNPPHHDVNPPVRVLFLIPTCRRRSSRPSSGARRSTRSWRSASRRTRRPGPTPRRRSPTRLRRPPRRAAARC